MFYKYPDKIIFFLHRTLRIKVCTLKNACVIISTKPDSLLHPSLSAGFLFKKPFRIEAALTDKDLGILMVFSKMT